MSTMRIRFEVVKHHVSKSGKCAACGKRTKRSKTFEATINPYNRNAQGIPKTRAEIRVDLVAKGDAWLAMPMSCASCE